MSSDCNGPVESEQELRIVPTVFTRLLETCTLHVRISYVLSSGRFCVEAQLLPDLECTLTPGALQGLVEIARCLAQASTKRDITQFRKGIHISQKDVVRLSLNHPVVCPAQHPRFLTLEPHSSKNDTGIQDHAESSQVLYEGAVMIYDLRQIPFFATSSERDTGYWVRNLSPERLVYAASGYQDQLLAVQATGALNPTEELFIRRNAFKLVSFFYRSLSSLANLFKLDLATGNIVGLSSSSTETSGKQEYSCDAIPVVRLCEDQMTAVVVRSALTLTSKVSFPLRVAFISDTPSSKIPGSNTNYTYDLSTDASLSSIPLRVLQQCGSFVIQPQAQGCLTWTNPYDWKQHFNGIADSQEITLTTFSLLKAYVSSKQKIICGMRAAWDPIFRELHLTLFEPLRIRSDVPRPLALRLTQGGHVTSIESLKMSTVLPVAAIDWSLDFSVSVALSPDSKNIAWSEPVGIPATSETPSTGFTENKHSEGNASTYKRPAVGSEESFMRSVVVDCQVPTLRATHATSDASFILLRITTSNKGHCCHMVVSSAYILLNQTNLPLTYIPTELRDGGEGSRGSQQFSRGATPDSHSFVRLPPWDAYEQPLLPSATEPVLSPSAITPFSQLWRSLFSPALEVCQKHYNVGAHGYPTTPETGALGISDLSQPLGFYGHGHDAFYLKSVTFGASKKVHFKRAMATSAASGLAGVALTLKETGVINFGTQSSKVQIEYQVFWLGSELSPISSTPRSVVIVFLPVQLLMNLCPFPIHLQYVSSGSPPNCQACIRANRMAPLRWPDSHAEDRYFSLRLTDDGSWGPKLGGAPKLLDCFYNVYTSACVRARYKARSQGENDCALTTATGSHLVILYIVSRRIRGIHAIIITSPYSSISHSENMNGPSQLSLPTLSSLHFSRGFLRPPVPRVVVRNLLLIPLWIFRKGDEAHRVRVFPETEVSYNLDADDCPNEKPSVIHCSVSDTVWLETYAKTDTEESSPRFFCRLDPPGISIHASDTPAVSATPSMLLESVTLSRYETKYAIVILRLRLSPPASRGSKPNVSASANPSWLRYACSIETAPFNTTTIVTVKGSYTFLGPARPHWSALTTPICGRQLAHIPGLSVQSYNAGLSCFQPQPFAAPTYNFSIQSLHIADAQSSHHFCRLRRKPKRQRLLDAFVQLLARGRCSLYLPQIGFTVAPTASDLHSSSHFLYPDSLLEESVRHPHTTSLHLQVTATDVSFLARLLLPVVSDTPHVFEGCRQSHSPDAVERRPTEFALETVYRMQLFVKSIQIIGLDPQINAYRSPSPSPQPSEPLLTRYVILTPTASSPSSRHPIPPEETGISDNNPLVSSAFFSPTSTVCAFPTDTPGSPSLPAGTKVLQLLMDLVLPSVTKRSLYLERKCKHLVPQDFLDTDTTDWELFLQVDHSLLRSWLPEPLVNTELYGRAFHVERLIALVSPLTLRFDSSWLERSVRPLFNQLQKILLQPESLGWAEPDSSGFPTSSNGPRRTRITSINAWPLKENEHTSLDSLALTLAPFSAPARLLIGSAFITPCKFTLSVYHLAKVLTVNEAEFWSSAVTLNRPRLFKMTELEALVHDHLTRFLFKQWYQVLLAFDVVGRPLSRIRKLWNSILNTVAGARTPRGPSSTSDTSAILNSLQLPQDLSQAEEQEEEDFFLATCPDSGSPLQKLGFLLLCNIDNRFTKRLQIQSGSQASGVPPLTQAIKQAYDEERRCNPT